MYLLATITLMMASILCKNTAFSCRHLQRTMSAQTFRRAMSTKGGADSSLPDAEAMMPFYALGLNVANQIGGELKGLLSKEELQSMLKGFNDSVKDEIAPASAQALLQEHGPKLNEVLTARSYEKAEAAKSKGQDFINEYLAKNADARQTQSGLVVHESVVGTGKQATIDSTVLVHYHGTLPDGTVFDSSVERGEPIKFPLKQVIQGWQEGVALMKEGGKATLVVPSHIGYGERGSPPVIPPSATLKFDVELIEVVE